ncbi:hypothetical protein BGZ75_006582 [Mortierella antarctica]|nr:hypothetical protein BGZ75_006582 [Mortierella antarctica]
MKAKGEGTSSTPSPSPSASSISKDAVSPSTGEDDNDHRVESWEINKSLPPAGYEDESFGLWIRPKERARTVTNGEDVEEAEPIWKTVSSCRSNAIGDESSLEHCQKMKKPLCVELEDMEVLKEVLDFSTIILMRASATLYSFIAKAHANSMPINISWILLQYKERGSKTRNIRTLKEYQDIVMADIGLAIQAINEIFDQQERPHGHPDNLSRDSKTQAGYKSAERQHQKKQKHSPTARFKTASNTAADTDQSCTGFSTTTPPATLIHLQRTPQSFEYDQLYQTEFTLTNQAGSTDQQLQLQLLLAQALNNNGSNSHGNNGGFLPQSIQNIFSSFRTSPNSPSSTATPGHIASPSSAPPTISKQEEKRLLLEHRWRVDILRRKAHLRGWACRNFLALYEYSIKTSSSSPTSPLAFSCSLEREFKDLYRIIHAIVQVDATATDRSHEILEAALAEAREHETGPSFRLHYSRYKTKAPTAKEIRALHLEAAKRFESQHAKVAIDVQADSRRQSESDGGSMNPTFDECVAPLKPVAIQDCTAGTTQTASIDDHVASLDETDTASAYDCMEFYGLQGHPVWEPLLDRLTKFDTTHHSLDARNVHQFLRRMSFLSPSVVSAESLLSDAARDELLAVLWVLERCVSERKDFQQSPTWFRMSSSASAVQEIYNAGGVIPYLKVLRREDAQGRDPIHTVHPVTLTGYFKRLLKDCGGLLMKEVTALFVELTSPSTDNGEFWTLDKLTTIDRALLYRLICLDMNRGCVFMRISRVMEQILGSSPKDMELDAFALSKMVQVVELSGVLDLKALRRWNGAWSAIILGYM